MRLDTGKPDVIGAERNLLIDALRFLAIVMVVMQHILNLRWEFKTIPLAPEAVRAMLSFNMPLFAFVSGYVLLGREKDSGWRLLSGKALALLIPYYAWIILEMPLRRIPLADVPLRLVQAIYDPTKSFQMWFLLVLFYAFVLFAVSRRINRSQHFTAALAVTVGLLPMLPLPDFNLLNRLCWLYPFFAFGYLAAQHRESLRHWDDAAAIAGLVAFPLLFWWGQDSAVYRLAIGAAGSAALWAICRPLPEAFLGKMAWAGQRTMGIYGWQMVVLPYLIVGSGWPGAFASWALVVVVTIVLTAVLERFKLTRALFLGRWPKRRPRTLDAPAGSGESA